MKAEISTFFLFDQFYKRIGQFLCFFIVFFLSSSGVNKANELVVVGSEAGCLGIFCEDKFLFTNKFVSIFVNEKVPMKWSFLGVSFEFGLDSLNEKDDFRLSLYEIFILHIHIPDYYVLLNKLSLLMFLENLERQRIKAYK